MPKVNVDIQSDVLKWAVSQVDEDQLGTKMMADIKLWIDGTKRPTFNQIEAFSRKANIPLGYLFLETPPDEDIALLDYRTIDSFELSKPSRNLIDTIHEMDSIQNWMREYRLEIGWNPLPFVCSMNSISDIDAIVLAIRKELELEKSWYEDFSGAYDAFKFVRSLLEKNGVIVMLNGVVGGNTHRVLSIEEFRAFAMVDKYAPLIFINNSDSQGAKLFSLFHEIAHIWIGENDLFNDRRNNQNVKPIEVLCNAVASELIVPYSEFANKWNGSQIEDVRARISEVASIFNCGESVIARKALDARFINSALYSAVIDDAINAYKELRNKQKSSGGNYYNTVVSRLDGCFVRALCDSVNNGRTTLTEACRLTNTNRITFPEIASRFGGVV